MRDLNPGDFLVFQLESGFALIRLLAIDDNGGELTWHLAAYNDLFFDVDQAETAALAGSLSVSHPHLALTTRAFESTQVARIMNIPLTNEELAALNEWRQGPGPEVSDRSVRLLMGLR